MILLCKSLSYLAICHTKTHLLYCPDSRQDLLNKIEYYQMEHDRLIDEIRRLKQRLGEVSPRSPRQRPASPRSHGNASYPGPSSRSSPVSKSALYSSAFYSVKKSF